MPVGPPTLFGEGGGDFGVFDDVGPVFEDPVVAGVTVGAGGAQDLVDVGEGELSGAHGVDHWAGVVGGGLEDLVEGVASLYEVVVAADRRPRRLVTAGMAEPAAGGGQPLVERRPLALQLGGTPGPDRGLVR